MLKVEAARDCLLAGSIGGDFLAVHYFKGPKGLQFIKISLAALMAALAFNGCGAPIASTRQARQPLASGSESPKALRTQTTPKLVGAPSYCKALVASSQSKVLERFVIETYNRSMQGVEGFEAGVVGNGAQPLVDFSIGNKPSIRPQSTKFHTTLCSAPQYKWFKCEDHTLYRDVAAHATSDDARSEYIKYYEKAGAKGIFPFLKARVWGSFVGIPLDPAHLKDKDEHIISGDLHVSLVKIQSAKTPESQALRRRFLKALRDGYDDLQALLPDGVTLDRVICTP